MQEQVWRAVAEAPTDVDGTVASALQVFFWMTVSLRFDMACLNI